MPPSLPDPVALAPRVAAGAREAASGIEFTSYLVGVRARALAKVAPEASLLAWKSLVKRAAGLSLADEWEPLGRRVAFSERPDLLLVWDHDRERIEALIRPVFLYGRYRKLVRDLPQTRATWPCPACRRRGCDACAGTGLRHPRSAEGLLAAPCARALTADAALSTLHGMGREDIDVRCLGPGRPFVLEVHAPRRRTTDLGALAREVERGAAGALELPGGLRVVDDIIGRVKEWRAAKVYRAVAEAAAPLDPARVDALAGLVGATIAQRTPVRVSRRRTDLVRARRVVALDVARLGPTRLELRIEAEAGTYIKELISGDEGRTRPSVASVLGAPCVCAELDVVEVRAADDDVLGDAPPPRQPASGEDEGD